MDIDILQKHYPFLTCIRHGAEDYVCIVQNADEKIISFYDYGGLNQDDQELFLQFGDIWWSESNRSIPINIFLRGQMNVFRYVLRTANLKDTEVVFGPVTSLANITNKRIKRRQIQLVRKID